MNRPFKVRDFRNKQFFMVDDLYLNGYARLLGTTASMVYINLCRHADKGQTCFPTEETIAKEIGVKERTVMEKIKILKSWSLISTIKRRSKDGKWKHNVYTLFDKSMWKDKPPTEKQQVEPPTVKLHSPPTVKQHLKGTQILRKHIKREKTLTLKNKYSSIKDIGEKEMQGLAETISVPISFVRAKYEDMVDWAEANGRQKKNWLATLRTWVRNDAMKLRKEASGDSRKRGIDASNL